MIKSVGDYVDGVAIAETVDGKFYFVDADMVPVNGDLPLDSIYTWVDGYAEAFSAIQKGDRCHRNYHIITRNGEVLVTQEYPERPIVIPGGYAWLDAPNSIVLKNLASGEVILEEAARVMDCAPSGTCVLVRWDRGRHPEGYEHIALAEFMVVDAAGRVIVPWGRIGFIGDFHNGLAIASNSIQGAMSEDIRRVSRSKIHQGKYGYINERGEWVIPEKFYWAEGFNKDGYAKVLTTSERNFWPKPKYIDRTGRVLSGTEADKARRSLAANDEEKKTIFK